VRAIHWCMFGMIFKFTIPRRQLRGHHVNSRRRIAPAGWSISDRLAEVEFKGHVARLEATTPSRIVQDGDTSRLAGNYRHACTAGKPSRRHAGTKEMVCLGEKVLWILELLRRSTSS